MPTEPGSTPRVRPLTWLAVGSGLGFLCGAGYVLLAQPNDQAEYADAQVFLPLACAVVGGVIGLMIGLLRV